MNVRAAIFRDPRYAPQRLEIEHQSTGEILLSNLTPFRTDIPTTTASLAHWAAAAPDRVWLAQRSGDGWRTLTYSEAWQRVKVLAGGLRDAGLARHSTLLILSNNSIDHALIRYAAMSQGVSVAPVSPQYGVNDDNPARLSHACKLLRPSAVFTEDAARFRHGLDNPALADIPVIAQGNARLRDIPLERLYRSAPIAPVACPRDHASYLLTSGSTDLPKAVIWTHRMVSTNAAQVEACFNDPEPPLMIHSAPWSHVLGAISILHTILHRGGTLYIDWGQPTADRFSETIRNLRNLSPTYQQMVPAGWMLLVEALEKDEALARTFFKRVRVLQYGGAALSQATADRIQRVAIRTVGQKISFASGYGATEVGTACNVHWLNDRMGMIGLPLPGTSVRLVPQAGKLALGVKGPQVTAGYLGRPDLSLGALDDKGFHVLGDAACFIDPAAPQKGMIFDGRLKENFKLASGTFVAVGALRIEAVGTIGGAVTDAVVCGEGEAFVGLLLYPNPSVPEAQIEIAVRKGLGKLNVAAKGSGSRIGRALVLPDAPDPAQGEITDKGYISQAAARRLRADSVRKLFADPLVEGVIQF